jgi:hypothetical protein
VCRVSFSFATDFLREIQSNSYDHKLVLPGIHIDVANQIWRPGVVKDASDYTLTDNTNLNSISRIRYLSWFSN